MRYPKIGLILASAFALANPASERAQTNAHWTAWLGCWAPDTSSVLGGTAASSITCVVPVANSTSVDALTIVRGAIASRDRLPASARSHAIEGQGCRGMETVSWSDTERRAYVRSAYTCNGGTKGTSSSIYAFTPRGEWLRATEVHSGGGSILSVERLHEVAAPDVVPNSALRAIDRQRLAITTARAAASAKVTVAEVMDALGAVDSNVVRSWILASNQSFDITSDEASRLARGNVPGSVMQALLGAREGVAANVQGRDVDEYLSTPTYLPQTALYTCPPGGCYAPPPPTTTNVYVPAPAPMYPSAYPYSLYPYGYSYPVIIHRGGERRGEEHRGGDFRGGGEAHRPPQPGPSGIPSRPRSPSGVRP